MERAGIDGGTKKMPGLSKSRGGWNEAVNAEE